MRGFPGISALDTPNSELLDRYSPVGMLIKHITILEMSMECALF